MSARQIGPLAGARIDHTATRKRNPPPLPFVAERVG